MIDRVFAPDYPRTEEGWVDFGRDTDMRQHYFPYTDPQEHIAKANMKMVEALVLYVSDEGETILDPFGGTGTTMIGAVHKRNIILMELVSTFVQTIELNLIGVKQSFADVEEYVTILPGNATSLLPIEDLCDHMIFSPPYPMGLKKSGEMDKTSKDLGYQHAVDYSEGGRENYTNLNEFEYHRKIKKFYEKCLQTVRVGGTMTVILKDRTEKGVRIKNSDRTIKDCTKMGWVLEARNKWYAVGGGYSAINRAAGLETVVDEDLMTFRRVE